MVVLMMKNNVSYLLPLALSLDLIIPFILAPFYKGYNHLTQVMSVFGNNKAPLHLVYNVWLIICGGIILLNDFTLYKLVSRHSSIIATLLFIIVLIYAVGGCILSGLFSVGETKSLVTLSAKIHGYGSVLGFMALVFCPLLIGIAGYKAGNIVLCVFSIICFMMSVIFFTLFVMADKPNYQDTIIAFEGLWQRLSLLFMYLPLGCLIFVDL